MERITFTITAENKEELSKKLETLYDWRKRRITQHYILFTNFERIYFNQNEQGFYILMNDTKNIFDKAKALNLITE